MAVFVFSFSINYLISLSSSFIAFVCFLLASSANAFSHLIKSLLHLFFNLHLHFLYFSYKFFSSTFTHVYKKFRKIKIKKGKKVIKKSFSTLPSKKTLIFFISKKKKKKKKKNEKKPTFFKYIKNGSKILKKKQVNAAKKIS